MRRALAAATLLLASCKRGAPVTQAECDRLLDRYTEMQMRVDGDRPSLLAIEQTRAEVRAAAASHPAFKTCTRDLSREQIDCALAAFNPDEIERCLVPVP